MSRVDNASHTFTPKVVNVCCYADVFGGRLTAAGGKALRGGDWVIIFFTWGAVPPQTPPAVQGYRLQNQHPSATMIPG